ncbi:MAG: 4-diphosphocytidyl-2-C-methyl-D-erythritol kinase [Candidatus Tectimicrobiota bacterium]|nr:MAG: 4-diphosphocytidyl-2-C-methyl-D-erythritol kinase [Candidatus Tectomicrobia bacterium]
MRCRAPAKINLGLTVHGRRPDGYHDLSTVFVKISLADTLVFTPAAPGTLNVCCDDPAVPCDESNLVYKAAALLQRQAPHCGVHIVLHKRIPVAAGLGGGSSDAATTLLALNRLWRLGLAREDLLSYAAQLGADVPFFLAPAVAAFGCGRGDELTPLPDPPPFALVLVKPHVAVSTAWVYQQLRLPLTARGNPTTILRDFFLSGNLAAVGAWCTNDLEEVVVRQFPVVAEAKRALRQPGVYGVSMSGSGPTVYALCPSVARARQVAAAVRSAQWTVWVCRPWRTRPTPIA